MLTGDSLPMAVHVANQVGLGDGVESRSLAPDDGTERSEFKRPTPDPPHARPRRSQGGHTQALGVESPTDRISYWIRRSLP